MKILFRLIIFSVISFQAVFAVQAQERTYKYAIDLTQVKNDQLTVELETPAVTEKSIQFYMPKIIPGTYRVSDYGLFISNVKAFDKKGKALPVNQTSTNSWEIKKADKMVKITYTVDDIFDAESDNDIYMMAATNIEAAENFVIQPPAFFGYLEGLKKIPFEVSITKPANFYGSTGLIPVSTSAEKDVFKTVDYDQLADSPLMYNVPDTTIITVGNAKVLVSVYSPNDAVTSTFLASQFDKMLQAQKKYLGDKLPVDKYAFILYFSDPKKAKPRQGALEHNKSSFYYISEAPQEKMAPLLVDIAAHEFFHIITPLTIHSEEIADFNFNEPVLSQHLWLYEGVTEYASDHIQVRSDLISQEEFLSKLAEKVYKSQSNYNDTLPFTMLSKESAGKYVSEYANVYEKGALIAALLDIRLIELSEGKMDLQDLILQLSRKYGVNKPFDDEQLFSQIEEMTYPEIGNFFKNFVEGDQQLPYKEYFEKVGVLFDKEEDKMEASLGKISLGYNPEKQMMQIANTAQMNDFGKQMGYKEGDLLASLQGTPLTPATFGRTMEDYSKNTKEGDTVEATVLRKTDTGEYEEVELSAPAMLVKSVGKTTLSLNPEASEKQLKLRTVWLQENPYVVLPEDVESVDAIITTLYEVISGPAGERDWDRFHSLFKPQAAMGAMVPTQDGKLIYKTFTPKEYQAMNAPHFKNNAFYEEEIGKEIHSFGEIAHVWSAYHFKATADGNPEQRGINSIQAVYDQGRWWITNILWNAEREDNLISGGLIKDNND